MVADPPTRSMPTAGEVAAALRDARFVRVVASADGAALAASGILAQALRGRGTPFQVRVRRAPAPLADDVVTVHVGTIGDTIGDGPTGDGPSSQDSERADDPEAERPSPPSSPSSPDLRLSVLDAAPLLAFEAARELGDDPDPVLALAGVLAEGVAIGDGATAGNAGKGGNGAEGVSALYDAAGDRLERRPGVGVPVTDLGDGIAHTTLFHAPFSGELEAVRAALADLDLGATLDGDDHRRVASLVALEATMAPDATGRAAETVGRVLRPHATDGKPFATVEGYADVLCAVAREAPGVGVGLALGHDVRTRALEAWRRHARAVHRTVHAVTLARYDGLVVARPSADDAPEDGEHTEASGQPDEVDDGDEGDAEERRRRRRLRLRSAARLVRDFQSPEPVALVVEDGTAAAASLGPDVGAALAAAARQVGGDAVGNAREADASYAVGRDGSVDAGLDDEYVNAVREALP